MFASARVMASRVWAGAKPLPLVRLPTAAETARHGLWPQPEVPRLDVAAAAPYREPIAAGARVAPLGTLSIDQIRATSRLMGQQFATLCPMRRHMRPRTVLPPALLTSTASDALGSFRLESAGQWDRALAWDWFIRLFLFTDPTLPLAQQPSFQEDVLKQSLVMVAADDSIMGAIISHTFRLDGPPPASYASFLGTLRANDPALLLTAEYTHEPVYHQWAEMYRCFVRLGDMFPSFAAASAAGRTGELYLLCRAPTASATTPFELLVRSMQMYADLGFEYVVGVASNPWTAAALSALGGRVMYTIPQRLSPCIPSSPDGLPDRTSSVDGFCSDRDTSTAVFIMALR